VYRVVCLLRGPSTLSPVEALVVPGSLVGVADQCRRCIQFFSAWADAPVDSDTKAVALEPRHDVQMDVEDLLKGRRAVREQEVDTLRMV